MQPAPKRLKAEDEVAAGPTRQEDGEEIPAAINPKLLECTVCFSPLKPPLFQCTEGHISCSECGSDQECLMCREAETLTRCRAMERVLDGLSLACAFRQHGCTEIIPYAEKQAHGTSCVHALYHCPIAGCAGYYNNDGSLRDHVEVDHQDLQRTRITMGFPTELRMRGGEAARVLWLGNGSAQFLLVVGRAMPWVRTLSMLRLIGEPLDKEDFKYTVQVVVKAGVLSLSGQAEGVERLTKPYRPNVSLFVPNAIRDADPRDISVFVELK